ncbi:hypothetical protein L861_10310 [Litchfieldella anticariensis FP35 = DSM 16096]|uniref:Uncharacterized protein n=1 Tax=Litchfieldella anticariensis (strain DSM 16096 / CECT 5854 / CIP 108499 / LMG 22089 / FP35) TaxID=1121939 RepID=S2L4T0_LITA3|nr:hypothetical protein L861_10310 [Halomonas anticariensis FP35 = DSM 16096]
MSTTSTHRHDMFIKRDFIDTSLGYVDSIGMSAVGEGDETKIIPALILI